MDVSKQKACKSFRGGDENEIASFIGYFVTSNGAHCGSLRSACGASAANGGSNRTSNRGSADASSNYFSNSSRSSSKAGHTANRQRR